jgi:octaprenyl-diphosphate synthase
MAAFELEYQRQFTSDDGILTPLLSLVGRPRGKRLRPMLFFLSQSLSNKGDAVCLKAAVLIELLHVASLVHDDVVDHSEVRRGEETVNAVWGNKAAVLLGDYLFARVLALAVELNLPGVLEIISQTVIKMGGGELYQTLSNKGLRITEAEYLRIIGGKTAGLFSAACRIAGLCSGVEENGQEQLAELGEAFGFLFQIQDDILDFQGYSETMGKPSSQDIQNGNVTLPMILALEEASADGKKAFEKHFSARGKADIDWIYAFLIENRGFEKARQKARQFEEKALDCLQSFPPSVYRKGLETLIKYGLARTW